MRETVKRNKKTNFFKLNSNDACSLTLSFDSCDILKVAVYQETKMNNRNIT